MYSQAPLPGDVERWTAMAEAVRPSRANAATLRAHIMHAHGDQKDERGYWAPLPDLVSMEVGELREFHLQAHGGDLLHKAGPWDRNHAHEI